MSQNKEFNPDQTRTYIKPLKWCHYIVNTGYATVVIITLAHVIWYFAAREVLAYPPDVYLLNYIVFPAIGLSAMNLAADFFVRSQRVTLVMKEYISLTLFLIFSLYLCLTHRIATVLLGAFVLSVFASTVFSNVKITRWTFLVSSLALLSCGAKIYLDGNSNSSTLMEIFVAWDMLLCSYLLAKVLIRYGRDNLVSLMHLYNQQQNMQEQLRLDLFTGLQNKKTFDDCLPKRIEECRSSNICLSLAVIDVDHFKRVNDVFGHAVGDRALLHLAQILKSNKTENISAFRIGGDEFAIIFKDYCVNEAYKICEGMRSIVESSSLHDVDKKINITFSCGLACMNLKHTSHEELLKAADSALYKAKSNYRNRVEVYDGSVQCVKNK